MRLWTIQPVEVWEEINTKGCYVCDINKTWLREDQQLRNAYDWLVTRMTEKIGKAPEGVMYPVWAWHTRDWKHKKPDLRCFGIGVPGTKSVCIEVDIPDSEVLLSDFYAWHIILNKWYFDNSTCEEEWEREHDWFDGLPTSEKEKVMRKSWEKVFDVTSLDNGWVTRGRYIQATFWILRKEYVKNVQFFTCR